MTIKEAQEQVDKWIKSVGVRYFSELTNMAILTEEVGEVARIIPVGTAISRLNRGRRTAIYRTNCAMFSGYCCALPTRQG